MLFCGGRGLSACGQEIAPAALLRGDESKYTPWVHSGGCLAISPLHAEGGGAIGAIPPGPPYDAPILASLACLAPARFQRKFYLDRPAMENNQWPEHSSPFISWLRLRPRRQHSIPAEVVNRTRVTALGQHYSSRIHCRRYKCPHSPDARGQETRASVTATAPETAAACTPSVQITADDEYHQYRPLADWREPHPAEAQVGLPVASMAR